MSNTVTVNPFDKLPIHQISPIKKFAEEEKDVFIAENNKLCCGIDTLEQRTKSDAAQATAVFRDKKTGQVLAIQWADGGTEFSGAGAASDAKIKASNDPRVERMSMDRQVEVYVQEIAKAFGPNVAVERYAGASAPKRGSIVNGIATDPRLADRSARPSSYSFPPVG